MFGDAGEDNTLWVCNCTIGGQAADMSKDPNCHNPSHAHYDPLSPYVLSYTAAREAAAGAVQSKECMDELDEILEDTNE
ncbi:unnamed protein product, partial [marine sediment metagenome]